MTQLPQLVCFRCSCILKCNNFVFSLQETAIKSIQKYGVGSCGPRGFYGTIGIGLFFFLQYKVISYST